MAGRSPLSEGVQAEAERKRAEFLAFVAHQLLTPVTILKASAELLLAQGPERAGRRRAGDAPSCGCSPQC